MARTLLAIAAAAVCMVLLVPAFAVAALMLGFASLVRVIGGLLEPRYVALMDLLVFDQALGWKPRPNLDTHYLAEHDDLFQIVTDNDGWAGRRSLEESDIVVIGDSFAFGYGVDTRKSFAEVDPTLRVKGVGAPGYSQVQGVLLMEQLGERLRGKLVVWFVYVENDLRDNLTPNMRTYRQPFVRPGEVPGEWEIARQHVSAEGWRCSKGPSYNSMLARLCTPCPISDRAYSACEYLIAEGARLCAGIGAHLMVMTIPNPGLLTASGRATLAGLSGSHESFDENLPDRRIAAACQRHGVPMIPGKAYLSQRDYKRREGIHWNERGNHQVAKLLRQVYASYRSDKLRAYIPHDVESAVAYGNARVV